MDTLRQQQFHPTCLSWRLGQGGMHKAALEKGTAWINTRTHRFRWTDMLFKEIINLWFWGFWASFLGSQCSDVCAEWGSQSLLLLRHVYLWGSQLKNSEDYFKKDHWYHCAKNLWHINSFSSLRRLNDLCSLAPTYLPFPSETACKLQAEMLCAPPFASTTWYCTQRQASLSTIKLIMACVSESWYPTVYCLYCILYAKTIVWLKCRSPVRICMSNHGGEYWQISESDLTNETKPSRGYSKQHMTSSHPQKFLASFHGYAPCSLVMLTNGLCWTTLKWSSNDLQ